MILPIETCQRMKTVLILVKVFIAERKQVSPMDAELVAISLIFRPYSGRASPICEGTR